MARRFSVKDKDGRGTIVTQIADDDPTRDVNTSSVKVFIDQSLNRWRVSEEAERYDRTEGLIDVLMCDGEGQWDSVVKAKREAKKRPCLTINRFIPMIAHVANEQRAAEFTGKVLPIGNGSDKDTADIINGLVRHIQYDSDSETIDDNAFEKMLEKGWSWGRIRSIYESPNSFNQKLIIEGFENDFCVYADPSAKDPTTKDKRWAHIVDDVPIGEYITLYPKSKLSSSLSNLTSIGDDMKDWLTTKTIRVVEYYYLETKEEKLFQLKDGTGKFENELTIDDDMALDDKGQEKSRMSERINVMWCKHNALEILEGNEDLTEGRLIGGKYIPLMKLQGRKRNINGKVRLSGLVRNNRDAQRMYNYWVTAFTEMVALAPKSPFIAEAGQIAKYKPIWDSANEEAWPYLPYDAITKEGQLVGPPQRNSVEAPVQAMIMAIRQADNDLKLGFNIFDASLGQKGPQESGTAINARKTESDSGNFNWGDNLRRFKKFTMDLILDLIPVYYDSERTISIIRENNTIKQVLINKMFEEAGVRKQFNTSIGGYACEISVGPKAGTKRQEAVTAMMTLVQADPTIFHLIGDIIVDHMDWPDSDMIVKRLRKNLQPGMLDEGDDETVNAEVKLQTLQQQNAQMSEQHDQLIQALTQATELIKNKTLELNSKERIEHDKRQIDLVKIMQEGDLIGFKAEIARIQHELDTVQQLTTAAHQSKLDAQNAEPLTNQADSE